jgi:hypothetical protein
VCRYVGGTLRSVAFKAVQFPVGETRLVQRFFGFAFRFPDLHVSGGLVLTQGNDLTHVCESSVVGGARLIVLHKHIRTLGERVRCSREGTENTQGCACVSAGKWGTLVSLYASKPTRHVRTVRNGSATLGGSM